MEKEEGGEGRRRRLGTSAATARVGTRTRSAAQRAGTGGGPSAAVPLASLLQVAQNFALRLLADWILYSRLPQPLKEGRPRPLAIPGRLQG